MKILKILSPAVDWICEYGSYGHEGLTVLYKL
jgi:hypothetical protein